MKHLLSKSIITISIFVIFYSCSTQIIKENDICNLPENYFICDSVESTPVHYELIWEPKEGDSVFIEIKSGICTDVEYNSGWLKDSVIQINFDSKREAKLFYAHHFSLTSYNDYTIHYNVSINGYELIDRESKVRKDVGSNISKYVDYSYMPVARTGKFLVHGGLKKLCWDKPVKDIAFHPESIDSLKENNPYGIRDYFTISVESSYPEVTLFDKYLKRNEGNSVQARMNDFHKYQLKLLAPYESELDDSVFVHFSIDEFVSSYKMVVTKNCPTKKPIVREVFIEYDKTSIYPGDTLKAYVSYRDEKGNKVFFDKSTLFEAGIIKGCDFAFILDPDGQKKSYFYGLKQPIKVAVDDSMPDGSENFILRVGHIPDED